ncbi:MAG TPA: hypothetical protein PLW14_03085 [Chlorobiota bacterium]|nr:hypothetical protein [Chlorobiota bacterium]
MLTNVLPTLGFTADHCHAARMWILGGDWRFKKSLSIDASDFFPTDDQLRQFREGMIPITAVRSLIAQQVEQSKRVAYQQGYDARKSAGTEEETVRVYADLARTRIELTEALQNLAQAERRLRELEAVRDDFKHERRLRIEAEEKLEMCLKTLREMEHEARVSLGMSAEEAV